jgi:hypothetical protein
MEGFLNVVQIPRKEAVAPADFVRDYLEGAGMPVVITDATDAWPARTKWTFEFFKSAFGADLVSPALGLDSDVVKVTKLSTYLDYLDNPDGELPGFWGDSKRRQPLRTPPPGSALRPYLIKWHAFQKHPELRGDIEPALYFVDDRVRVLSSTVRETLERVSQRVYSEVIVGPEGSLSNLHQDFQHTHACLAQIQGRKHARLFSPEDLEQDLDTMLTRLRSAPSASDVLI